MGHAPTVLGVLHPSVADFLKDEVAAWVVGQVGDASDECEVSPMAVEVAGDHHFVRHIGGDRVDSPLTSWRFLVCQCRF